MRPLKRHHTSPIGGYTTIGRCTIHWGYDRQRFAGRIGQNRRAVTACWPLVHWLREYYSYDYDPYPPPDRDIWKLVYWRRLRRPAGQSSVRLVEAELDSARHRSIARRSRHFRAPRFSRWYLMNRSIV